MFLHEHYQSLPGQPSPLGAGTLWPAECVVVKHAISISIFQHGERRTCQSCYACPESCFIYHIHNKVVVKSSAMFRALAIPQWCRSSWPGQPTHPLAPPGLVPCYLPHIQCPRPHHTATAWLLPSVLQLANPLPPPTPPIQFSPPAWPEWHGGRHNHGCPTTHLCSGIPPPPPPTASVQHQGLILWMHLILSHR